MKWVTLLITILLGVSSTFLIMGNSVAYLAKKPTITIRWENDPTEHRLTSGYLWEYPFFGIFDKSVFSKHQLPTGPIPYRYNTEIAVDGNTLSILLEQLMAEILQKKTAFTHFTVLRDRTFNRELNAGSITLKFNDYPFVVKLFIENPYSFVNPFKKGGDLYLMHMVSGGINHHLAGFTRITNLMHIKQKLAQDQYWSSRVDTPRKWFWVTEKSRLLTITGQNFESAKPLTITIPSMYCVIADAIEAESTVSCNSWADIVKLSKKDSCAFKEQADLSKKLCEYLDFCIDLGMDNFIVERGTKKLVIIDTEHYPSLAGLMRKPPSTANYLLFNLFLLSNSLRNALLTIRAII